MGQSLCFCCNRKTSYCLTKSVRERNVHKVLRLLEGVQIVSIDKGFEFTRNLSWSRSYRLFLRLLHLHFSTYWWSERERERERERDANDEMKLWAIYKGLHIIGLFIWVDLTRRNNLDNIRSWTLGFLFLYTS